MDVTPFGSALGVVLIFHGRGIFTGLQSSASYQPLVKRFGDSRSSRLLMMCCTFWAHLQFPVILPQIHKYG